MLEIALGVAAGMLLRDALRAVWSGVLTVRLRRIHQILGIPHSRRWRAERIVHTLRVG